MAAPTEDRENSRRSKTGGRKPRIALTLLGSLLFIGGICLLVARWSGEPLEWRIAAVNIRHALAPEENAATIYDQLAASDVLTGDPADPQLAPAAMAALIEAAKIESCWFPLSPGERCYRDHTWRMSPMREWARALANAAKKDVADGQVDAAAQKLQCIMRMGDHLRQQPLMIDFAVGCGIELGAWSCLSDLVMQPDAAEGLLGRAEAMSIDLTNDSKQTFQRILEVQPLIATSVLAEWSLRRRVENWWRGLGGKTDEEYLQRSYLRLLSLRRGVRVLVGLRRYHDANGRWPESLDGIRSLVPKEALIDPYTEQLFVYKPAGSKFRLYVKGPNRIDEGGASTGNADDRRIWPPYNTTPQLGKQGDK